MFNFHLSYFNNFRVNCTIILNMYHYAETGHSGVSTNPTVNLERFPAMATSRDTALQTRLERKVREKKVLFIDACKGTRGLVTLQMSVALIDRK